MKVPWLEHGQQHFGIGTHPPHLYSRPSPSLSLSEGQLVDLVDLVRKVHLLLFTDDSEACPGHQALHQSQFPAHAAVDVVWDHALIGHVVLDDN